MSDLECPYCENEVNPDEEHNEDIYLYEKECPHCGKNFQYSVTYYPSYRSYKADCLNGAPHDYQSIKGYPVEFFANKKACTICGDEIEVKP